MKCCQHCFVLNVGNSGPWLSSENDPHQFVALGNFLSASFSVQVGGCETGEGAHHDGQPVRGLQPRPRHPLLQRQRDLRQHPLQQARRIIIIIIILL